MKVHTNVGVEIVSKKYYYSSTHLLKRAKLSCIKYALLNTFCKLKFNYRLYTSVRHSYIKAIVVCGTI